MERAQDLVSSPLLLFACPSVNAAVERLKTCVAVAVLIFEILVAVSAHKSVYHNGLVKEIGRIFRGRVRTSCKRIPAGYDGRMGANEDSVAPGLRYVRPSLPEATHHSGDGVLIPYGRRWGEDGPSPDSYSVETHLDRFAGLHVVARALINHLSVAYNVDVEDSPTSVDLLRQPDGVAESVRVTPRRPGAAPLTFVFTRYPAVIVHAGSIHDFVFPACGCDACDETAESAADRLEMLVLAVAAGGYSERYPVGWRRWVEYALKAADGSGSESGQDDPGPIPADRLRDVKIRLRAVPAAWLPWPPCKDR